STSRCAERTSAALGLQNHPGIPFLVLCLALPPPPRSTLFPYTTLFRSQQYLLELHGDLGDVIRMVVAVDHGASADIVGAGRDYVDRKSTRLNSSHVAISYAVFCLKKKNRARRADGRRDRCLRAGARAGA